MQNCKQKLTTLTKLFLFMIALLMFTSDPVMAANDVDQQNTIVIPAEPDLGELVDNQIPGWQTSHAVRGKIRVVDSISYSGDYSVHIADDDGLAYGLESSFVPVVAGEAIRQVQ